MVLRDLASVVSYDEDDTAEELLAPFDAYIVALVGRWARRSSSNADPGVLDLEIDEIAQRVRIKLWQALHQKRFAHPEAYIRCIVHNEFVDLARQHRRTSPLPMDAEGELYQGKVLVAPSEGMRDPLSEFELHEMASEYIMQAVEALLSLPPCQRRVMICSLKERLDDILTTCRGVQRAPGGWHTGELARNKSDMLQPKASLSPALMLGWWDRICTNRERPNTS